MTDIKDIKPDTSLYSDKPSRFRALALIAEAQESGKAVQLKHKHCDEWYDGVFEFLDRDSHYRIKPEPRVVFLISRADGTFDSMRDTEEYARALVKAWDREYPSSAPHAFVRFVESPQ